MVLGAAALLFGAGIAAGIVNALAGGSTLFTFPALMAAGLPPIVANASNSLAVMPANLIAVIADRGSLPRRGRHVPRLAAIALVGGLLGAVLLLNTPERLFTQLVPALIGGATLVFAFARKIQSVITRVTGAPVADGSANNRLTVGLLIPACIYGGYFGAGLGVMLMSIFALGGLADVRRANALKNLMSATCAIASVSAFVAQGVISWPETLSMMAGAVIGGAIGGRMIRSLSGNVLRITVVIVGVALTLVYANRYWV